jgi:hypothetical protein
MKKRILLNLVLLLFTVTLDARADLVETRVTTDAAILSVTVEESIPLNYIWDNQIVWHDERNGNYDM